MPPLVYKWTDINEQLSDKKLSTGPPQPNIIRLHTSNSVKFGCSFENVYPTRVLCKLEVHESVHRDTTTKITNKMHYID